MLHLVGKLKKNSFYSWFFFPDHLRERKKEHLLLNKLLNHRDRWAKRKWRVRQYIEAYSNEFSIKFVISKRNLFLLSVLGDFFFHSKNLLRPKTIVLDSICIFSQFRTIFWHRQKGHFSLCARSFFLMFSTTEDLCKNVHLFITLYWFSSEKLVHIYV